MKKTIALVSYGYDGICPPLGLLYLVSWLRYHCAGWDVMLLDTMFREDVARLRDRYDFIGFSASTPYYESVVRLAGQLRARGVRSPFIIGGVHITLCPGSRRDVFDLMFTGEAEYKLQGFLNAGATDCSQVPDLVEYPDLDWSALNPFYFTKRPLRLWRDTVIEGNLLASRGCIFKCRFCATTMFWRNYKAHTPDWIVRQLGNLVARGCTHIRLSDDLFVKSKPRLREIATQFERAGLRRTIRAVLVQGRATLLDAEVCDLLRSMNVTNMTFGLESGSDRVLRLLKTGKSSVASNTVALKLTLAHGIKPEGSLIIASPGETVREMLQTMGWALRMFFQGVHDMHYVIAELFPGTAWWDDAKRAGHVQDRMDFDTLTAKTFFLATVPRWQARLMFKLTRLVLLPYKLRKYLTCPRALFTPARKACVDLEETGP